MTNHIRPRRARSPSGSNGRSLAVLNDPPKRTKPAAAAGNRLPELMAQIAAALDQGRAIDSSVLTRAAVEALKSADPSTVASTLALLAVNQQLAELVEEFFALNYQVHDRDQRQGLYPEDEVE